MIILIWHIVRSRLTSLVGTFVALGLGVALLTATALSVASTAGNEEEGPRWFTTPYVVVAGTDTARLVPDGGGSGSVEVRTAERRPIPPQLAQSLSTVGATVVDYAAYAASDAPGDTLHPWSAAGLHGYAWEAGEAPAAADQIVLTAPATQRPGDRITVQTALGPREFTVSGVLRTEAPAALYATDDVAAELAGGRIHAIALNPLPGRDTQALPDQVRQAVGDAPVEVLTGDARRDAEPDPEEGLFEVAASLLGTTSGLSGFVSIFVVAGTFAYAVAARRREFGLLRTAGATPRQVRRLVLGEALLIGIFASFAGCVLGILLAPPFAEWMARAGFAPSDFTARFIFWPVALMFCVGLVVAVLGAWLAARRASQVRPIEALREASVEQRTMTTGRWIVGIGTLVGGLVVNVVLMTSDSTAAIWYSLIVTLLLIISCAMLSPRLVRLPIRLVTARVASFRGAVGVLARESTLSSVRRTAATTAPIVATIAISGSLLIAQATLVATTQAAERDRVRADSMVAGEIAEPTVEAMRAVPGVTAAVAVTETPVYVYEQNAPPAWTARYIDGAQLPAVLDLPVVDGDLDALTGTDTVVVPAGRWSVGDTAAVWLADGTEVRLRVVAVVDDDLDLAQTLLLPAALRDAHTSRPVAEAVYLGLSDGADLTALARAAEAGGGTVVRTSDLLSAANAEEDRVNELATIAVLGLSLIYTAIAIANTLVMATSGRVRDLATLRLTGATPRQVLRSITVEAGLVTFVGALYATVVVLISMLATGFWLASRSPELLVDVPWLLLGAIVAGCLAIAVLASVLPAGLLLRRRPIELASIRE